SFAFEPRARRARSCPCAAASGPTPSSIQAVSRPRSSPPTREPPTRSRGSRTRSGWGVGSRSWKHSAPSWTWIPRRRCSPPGTTIPGSVAPTRRGASPHPSTTARCKPLSARSSSPVSTPPATGTASWRARFEAASGLPPSSSRPARCDGVRDAPAYLTPSIDRQRLLRDPDQLLVDELVHPVRAELASEAGTLDAPERQLGAVEEDAVHEDHAGVDLVGDAIGLLRVRREQIGAEAVRRVVRDPDRLLLR